MMNNRFFNPRTFSYDLFLKGFSFSNIVLCLYIEFDNFLPNSFTIDDCINLMGLYFEDFVKGSDGCDI